MFGRHLGYDDHRIYLEIVHNCLNFQWPQLFGEISIQRKDNFQDESDDNVSYNLD